MKRFKHLAFKFQSNLPVVGKLFFVNEKGDSVINHYLERNELNEKKYFVHLNDLQPGLYQILFVENKNIIDQQKFTYYNAASDNVPLIQPNEHSKQIVPNNFEGDNFLTVTIGDDKEYIVLNNINNQLKNGSEITIFNSDKKLLTKKIIEHKSELDLYKIALDLNHNPEIFIKVDDKLLMSVKDY